MGAAGTSLRRGDCDGHRRKGNRLLDSRRRRGKTRLCGRKGTFTLEYGLETDRAVRRRSANLRSSPSTFGSPYKWAGRTPQGDRTSRKGTSKIRANGRQAAGRIDPPGIRKPFLPRWPGWQAGSSTRGRTPEARRSGPERGAGRFVGGVTLLDEEPSCDFELASGGGEGCVTPLHRDRPAHRRFGHLGDVRSHANLRSDSNW